MKKEMAIEKEEEKVSWLFFARARHVSCGSVDYSVFVYAIATTYWFFYGNIVVCKNIHKIMYSSLL